MKTNIIRYKGKLGEIVSDYNDIKRFHPVNYGSYYSDQLEKIDENFVEETTSSDKVKFIEMEFHWGNVIRTHLVGEYQIIEYEATFNGKNEGIQFHGYINFVNTNHSYKTLDNALIGAIAYKYDGCNSQAAYFIKRMLGNGIDKDSRKRYYEE